VYASWNVPLNTPLASNNSYASNSGLERVLGLSSDSGNVSSKSSFGSVSGNSPSANFAFKIL
jgi:hypothetical protein